MSNVSQADALRVGLDEPGIAPDTTVAQSSTATSSSTAAPPFSGDKIQRSGDRSLNQVIAQGDLALRAIRYRKRAAEFEAAAMELEQAILLAKNGQPLALQRWLDGQSKTSKLDVDQENDLQKSDQHCETQPNLSTIKIGPETQPKSTSIKTHANSTPYEVLSDSKTVSPNETAFSESTREEQPSATTAPLNDEPRSTKSETRTKNPKPAKKSQRDLEPSSPSPSARSGKKSAKTKTPKERNTQKRLSSWGISTIVHLCLVMALAVVTIKGMDPPKATSIMAGTVDSNEVSMVPDELSDAMSTEFDIEAVDADQELPQEPSLNVEHGTLQMASSAFEMEAGSGPGAVADAGNSISEQVGRVDEMSSGSMVKKTGASFFGTEAVGNTFVYIVDSSGSMRRNGAFDTAKLELARSLYSMKPKQRFYIYFFSEKIDRLTVRGEEPEKFPIHATPENIELAIRWMQTIQIRGGKGPNDVLGEAISQRPDGVFLMFDGDTKMDVAKHLRKINRTNDFISGEIPSVPIHTIGFNSEEFSESLRKIASENLGTYRFVTPPPSPNPRRKM